LDERNAKSVGAIIIFYLLCFFEMWRGWLVTMRKKQQQQQQQQQ
jgi:hypothetical protein